MDTGFSSTQQLRGKPRPGGTTLIYLALAGIIWIRALVTPAVVKDGSREREAPVLTCVWVGLLTIHVSASPWPLGLQECQFPQLSVQYNRFAHHREGQWESSGREGMCTGSVEPDFMAQKMGNGPASPHAVNHGASDSYARPWH